jgi:uncharacterized protein
METKNTQKQEFLGKLQEYLNRIDKFFESKNIDLPEHIFVDHICYKCSSKEEFEMIRSWFEFEDSFIFQSIISKRRISIIGFANGLVSKTGLVFYLELSDQKPDNSQVSKVDHIEIASSQFSYDELQQHFKNLGFEIEIDAKPHHTTYNFTTEDGLEIKLCNERLVDKIAREEMTKKRL